MRVLALLVLTALLAVTAVALLRRAAPLPNVLEQSAADAPAPPAAAAESAEQAPAAVARQPVLDAAAPAAAADPRLEPLPPGGLRVRVVDADSTPVAGVPVALGLGARGATGMNTLGHATTRAPDGLARIDLAEVEQLRRRMGPLGFSAKLLVAADVAAVPPVRLDLDGWPTDGDEVQLELPPTGSLAVRVLAADGAPFEGPVDVYWWWLPADVAAAQPDSGYERVPQHLAEGRAGLARIDGIGLGLALEVRAFADGFESAAARGIAGPAVAGEVVEVALRLGPPLARLRLTVRDPYGRPVGDARLWCELWLDPDRVSSPAAGPQRPLDVVLETDGEGRAELTRPSGRREVAPRLDVVRRTRDLAEADDPDWSVGRVSLPAELSPGEVVELGTVRLEPVPVLAAGRVLDGAGRPVAGARLWFVQRFGPLPDHRWHNLARVDADPDGRFRLRGVRVPRALGVRVEAANFARREIIELVPGDEAIEIALEPAEVPPPMGTLALEVRLDDPALAMQMLLRVGRPGAGTHSPDWFGGHRIDVVGLSPGTYDVWVETRDGGLRIGGVDGVAVRAGERTEDLRLLPLDLRGAVRWVTLEVVRPDGTARRRQPVWIDPPMPRSSFRVTTDDGGRAGFVLPAAMAQVRVGLDADHLVDVSIPVGAAPVLRVELGE